MNQEQAPGAQFGIRGPYDIDPRFIESVERTPIPKEEREQWALEINTIEAGVNRYLIEHGDGFIIDMASIPKIDAPAVSPQKGIKELETHAKVIKERLDELPPEWESYGQEQLTGAIAFLQEKEKPKDRKTPYLSNVRTISGFFPGEIPEPILERDRNKLALLLRTAGFPNVNGDNESLSQAFQEYHALKAVSSKDDIEKGMKSAFYEFRARLAQYLGRPEILQTTFDINFVQDEAPYMAWERVFTEGNRLDINIHPSKMVQWGWEEIARYARHEGLHFIMGGTQAEEIRSGRLDSIAGHILIPSPVCWGLEGAAQAVDELAGMDSNIDERISVAAYRVFVRARNNALLYLETGRLNMTKAIRYMARYAPQKSADEIERDLTKGTEDPLWRPFLPIYGHSDLKIMNVAEGLRVHLKKQAFEDLLTGKTMTHSQFKQTHGRIAA